MKPTIVRNITRPDADAVRTLGELGVATVHEAQGRTGLITTSVAGSFMPPGEHLILPPGMRTMSSSTTVSLIFSL